MTPPGQAQYAPAPSAEPPQALYQPPPPQPSPQYTPPMQTPPYPPYQSSESLSSLDPMAAPKEPYIPPPQPQPSGIWGFVKSAVFPDPEQDALEA